MVSIINHRPMTLGILPMLDAYINHQKDVILRRTRFDLSHAKKRLEIVSGLIKAIGIIDEVIRVIRSSKNKDEAIVNLVKEFEFTEIQADAIVKLQLYRLTNTDVEELEEEIKRLKLTINMLEAILNDEEKLKDVMKQELRNVKKEYARPRKTEIVEEIREIKIDTISMIPKEDCIVVVTNEGYVKRVSNRSYSASNGEDTLVKEGDHIIGLYELNTLDTLVVFTDAGNYLYIPVHELPDLKWKELGKHVSNIIKISADENIIGSLPVVDFNHNRVVTMISKEGMIKRTLLLDFKVQRYSKPITCMKLKSTDKVVDIGLSGGRRVFITTHNGYGLNYSIDEVSLTGIRSSGVKAISLKNDFVVSMSLYDNEEYLSVITTKQTGKRIKLTEFEPLTRARKGIQIIRDVKTNPYYIIKTFITDGRSIIGLKTNTEINEIRTTELPIADRYSTGTSISNKKITDVFELASLSKTELIEEEVIEEPVTLQSVDERIMTIDDFLDSFDIDEK